MSSLTARIALEAYRLAGMIAYPLVSPYLAFRAAKGKEDRARRDERFGFASANRPQGPLIWFHAASVGETSAVIPLIREIRRRGIHVVLTTGTITSAKLAATRLGDEAIHQYVPLDLKPAIRRFLDYWQPDCAVMAESEIWPMTIMELGRQAYPSDPRQRAHVGPVLRPLDPAAGACRGAVRELRTGRRAVRHRRAALPRSPGADRSSSQAISRWIPTRRLTIRQCSPATRSSWATA